MPLTGGFYVAKSIIAGAQRAVNVYAEANPQDAPFPYTTYDRPGLTRRYIPTPQTGCWRGLYTATNGKLFGVMGSTVYYIPSSLVPISIGTINSSVGPVSFSDNRIIIVLVDGSPNGYTINPTSLSFATIVDAAFYGANRVDYLDTFFTFNVPNTNEWYISLSEWDGVLPFDPLDIATKTGAADGISTCIVNNRNIWLLGDQESSEVWYNVGKPDFTFERMPGIIINHGCAATYSAAWYGNAVFWVGVDPSGAKFALMGIGYEAKVVTTPAVQNAWTSYATISDAIGFTFQIEGHAFWVITFPTADKTWAFDITESTRTGQPLWYEWVWQDVTGDEHRWRANCHAQAYGLNIVGDYENGALYALDQENFTDDGNPIVRRRGFPHLIGEGDRITVKNIIARMQVGAAYGETTDRPAQVSLRCSTTGGASYGNPILQSVGSGGQYGTSPQWNQIGMGRDWVFELFWDFPFKTALDGLFLDADKLGS
jgi:hypothetical protein